MKSSKSLRVIAALVLCAVSLAAAAQAPTSYRLTLVFKRFLDPGSENDEFHVNDINDKGQLAGYRIGPVTGAFIWRNGQFEDIIPPNAHLTWAFGINDWSEVAGSYLVLATEQWNAFIRRGTNLIPVGAGQSLLPIHINNRRQMVVSAEPGGQHFIWRRGQLTPLDQLPGMGGTPLRINDQGVVVGTASAAGDSVPVIWRNGEVMALPLPEGASGALGRDINDHGTVLVNAGVSQQTVSFLWEDGEYTALPVLQGRSSGVASSLNNSDVAVGSTSGPFGTVTVATAWYGQEVVDLNTMVRANDPLRPHVTLERAILVNDRGEIVAIGQDRRDFDAETPAVSHYLLTPID
jgi:uncharacterized membrane protein